MSGMLGDDEGAVARRLDDRIADVGEIGNVAPVVQAVAARALRAALDDVAGDDPRGEPIVIRRRAQPNSKRSGAIVSAVSVERPVIDDVRAAASASTIGTEPMYALAESTRSRTVASGSPVSMLRERVSRCDAARRGAAADRRP